MGHRRARDARPAQRDPPWRVSGGARGWGGVGVRAGRLTSINPLGAEQGGLRVPNHPIALEIGVAISQAEPPSAVRPPAQSAEPSGSVSAPRGQQAGSTTGGSRLRKQILMTVGLRDQVSTTVVVTKIGLPSEARSRFRRARMVPWIRCSAVFWNSCSSFMVPQRDHSAGIAWPISGNRFPLSRHGLRRLDRHLPGPLRRDCHAGS